MIAIVHINSPRGIPSAIVADCPTCKRPRRMFAMHYEWYGPTVVCAGCGDTWHDGEMAERPFAPGWRRKNIQQAIKGLASIGVQA